jgi:DNA polymerase-3 subunit alpha
MKMVTEEMRPKTFMDLAAINALSRPGPLHSGQTGDYIAIRHGKMEREKLHPIVDEICSMTEGQIIYQEQVLQICREVGKFPWVHAATIRKVIAQKKGEAAFNTLWGDFLSGARENGISEELARRIWNKMVTSGTYSFNIAHCVSYSMLGFWAMWLKVHHPLAFYAAQLQKLKEERQLDLMRDMQDPRFGRSYAVHPPDPNLSGLTWTPGSDGVYAGLTQIKGIGEKTAHAIIKEREDNGDYNGWGDLIAVKGIGAKGIENIRAFCEQDDPFGIQRIRRQSAEIRKCIQLRILPGLPLPNTLSDQVPYEDKKSFHVIMGVVKSRNLKDLFEDWRSRTGEVLNPDEVDSPHLKDSVTLYMEDEAGLMTVKVNRWVYPRFKADVWGLTLGHHFVIAKVEKKPFYGKTVHVKQMWVVDPCDGPCTAERVTEDAEIDD